MLGRVENSIDGMEDGTGSSLGLTDGSTEIMSVGPCDGTWVGDDEDGATVGGEEKSIEGITDTIRLGSVLGMNDGWKDGGVEWRFVGERLEISLGEVDKMALGG